MARTNILPAGVTLGLTLDRYQEIKRLPIAAFNGLSKPGEGDCFDCAAIWKQTDRDGLALAISNAEEMRENELGYFTAPKYIVNEEHSYENPLILSRKHLIAVGKKAVTIIQAAVALNHGVETTPNDPVVLVVPTTVTDVNEIKVYYPGELVEIHPSSVALAGGIATIQIPRARLALPTLDTNCDPAPSYYENDNFLATVDVVREYIDPSDAAHYVWFPAGCNCSTPSLTETTRLAYSRITSNRLSIIEMYPASYSIAGWVYSTAAVPCLCATPNVSRVSYLSGRYHSTEVQMSTAKLAHTLLHEYLPDRMDLCGGCWTTDRNIDDGNEYTPYGRANGAIEVWLADSRSRIGHGGKFPIVR